MQLEELFDEVSKKIRSDFARAQKSLTHAGLKGNANEETVREFLRQYLPKTLDISEGMLFDSEGKQSRQLDIIVSDAAKTPIFFQSGNTRVIPIECAYAVIEVKAFLDKSELEKAYSNMKSVKTLTKKEKAFFRPDGHIQQFHTVYGKKWNYWPIHYFIFAYDSASMDHIINNLDQLQNNDEVYQRIDMICVLDKGVILNRWQNGMFSALPNTGSCLFVSHTSKPLLFFYALISFILNQAHMDYFNLFPYLQSMRF
ncbi:MAG TPA: DUF6602 domain-containing protein [archaeon]|nr:DUF6602 domain-containing protein [archaeon]